jgi:DNA-binding response OmpR family regulator
MPRRLRLCRAGLPAVRITINLEARDFGGTGVQARTQLVYEAGGWEIDAGRRELRLRGASVPLGLRAFEVLETLVKSAGQLVTKDDLMG